MKIRFKCPACMRKSLSANVIGVGAEIIDKTCSKCGVAWRYKITGKRCEPTPGRDGLTSDDFIHVIQNIKLLKGPKAPATVAA